MSKVKNKLFAKGFSLVEMSIVLASVAAVTTMVIGGSSMINKTETNVIISDINKFKEAIINFERKNGSLPGDIANTSAIKNSTGSAGNGNGIIDTDAEALNVWRHLSLEGLIDGNYDGSSENNIGRGVPAAKIEHGGYNIKIPSDVTAASISDQDIVVELAGFNGISNNLPIITSENAKSIDDRIDDGNPSSGIVLAEGTGTECVASDGKYNLTNESISCRVLFVIRPTDSLNNAPLVTGACVELGQSRQSTDTNNSCPEGYEGIVTETCRIDENNVGTWEITERNCIETKCDDRSSIGETRKLSCINGMKGNEGIIEQCTNNGTWKVLRSDCKHPSDIPCATENSTRKAQACDWDETGFILQTCTNGKWDVPTSLPNNKCEEIKCGLDDIGDTNVTNNCGTNYTGNSIEVCTMAGTWETTHIGSKCNPVLGSCNASTDNTNDIGCSAGTKGKHIVKCIENGSNDYWSTIEDACEPIKCSGGKNVGSARVVDGAACPNDSNGTVMEYCDENGTWQPALNNCVTGVCEEPKDNKGNAHWPTSIGGTNNVQATSCILGYKQSSASKPTRNCLSNGTWANNVNDPCERITCPAIPTANYNGTVTNDHDAYYPVTYAGETNVSAAGYPNQCQNGGYEAPEGYPVADCDMNGNWNNERIGCKLSTPLPDPCFNDTGPIMGRPECPSGNLLSNVGNWGCARYIPGGGGDPNDINDVMFFAGNVPGTTTDLFVRRCDLGQDWDNVAKRCKHSDGTTTTRQLYQWKDSNTESALNDINDTDVSASEAIHGNINTSILVADTSGSQPAAEACASLPGGGWYLPSAKEIDSIYSYVNSSNDDPDNPRTTSLSVSPPTNELSGTLKGPLYCSFRNSGSLYDTIYWSSTEPFQDHLAFRINMSVGNLWYVQGKTDYFNVRCARR